MTRLRFGIFMAPFHSPPGQNPTTALARDVATIEQLDELGYDEAWIGEHHSCGTEIIASPEIFIAHVASRTRHIKLGTGVLSLPYHNPLWVADRMVLLDHLSRGRTMLGVGPGSLPTDAAMLGIPWPSTRQRMVESWEAVYHLLTNDEPLSVETDWFTLDDAVLQLAPFSNPTMEIAFTAMESPFGPSLASKYGARLIPLSAMTPEVTAAACEVPDMVNSCCPGLIEFGSMFAR